MDNEVKDMRQKISTLKKDISTINKTNGNQNKKTMTDFLKRMNDKEEAINNNNTQNPIPQPINLDQPKIPSIPIKVTSAPTQTKPNPQVTHAFLANQPKINLDSPHQTMRKG